METLTHRRQTVNRRLSCPSIVCGAPARNIQVRSVSDSHQGGKSSNGPVQPFGNCGFPGGLYLTSAPIIAVN
jgi:hypothetical protein